MLSVHTASIEEVPLLLEMIREFATFEVTITEAVLARDGFGPQPRFRTLIAEWSRAAAGYSICFPIYSTFQGPALFLEDVYVRPQFREKGIGKALIERLRPWRCAKGAAPCVGKCLRGISRTLISTDGWERLFSMLEAVRIEGEALRRLRKATSKRQRGSVILGSGRT